MKNKLHYLIIIITVILVTLGLIYYFNLKTVENRIFMLNGSNEISFNIGDKWEDPGFIYQDDGKDLSNEVNVDSNVDINKVGNYVITYTVKVGFASNSLTRKVNVLNSNINSNFYFFLKGTPNQYLLHGEEYKDPGCEAIDKTDGNISSKIIKTGSVNNTVDGTYELNYKITNSNGVTKERTRKVIVYSFNFNGTIKYDEMVKENEIIIDISEDNYQYTLLPSGEKITNKHIIYKVNKNGTYIFNIYDKHNSVFKYEAVVSNIDTDKPSGTCEIVLNDKGANITVDAKDNGAIKGYIYQYGKTKTELKEENKLTINTIDEKASVTIYDQADNMTTITCKVINKSTIVKRNYVSQVFTTSNGKQYEYWFYTPKHTKREKLPLLIYFHGDGGKKGMKEVNNYAYPAFISSGMDFPFYMIAPHVDNTDDFGTDARMEKTHELIKYIISNYDIDTNRIIISGGSSGARGAYRMAARYKDLFSCMVIGSGISYQLYDEQLTHLPIWFFHGEKDSVLDYRSMERHVKKINELGGNAKITIIQGGGHDITETVFKRDDLIKWMVSQKKK